MHPNYRLFSKSLKKLVVLAFAPTLRLFKDLAIPLLGDVGSSFKDYSSDLALVKFLLKQPSLEGLSSVGRD
jgi:hypothetical protein